MSKGTLFLCCLKSQHRNNVPLSPRETDDDACTGCGECVDICPVDALVMEDDLPRIDTQWCIGCGVCVSRCPTGAARLKIRPDKRGDLPADDFDQLHKMILKEKQRLF